jgi:hypothetical protein
MGGLKGLLSRINRGIALGVVLLAGLAVYFVTDARAFDAEVYKVRDVVFAFVDAVEELNHHFSAEGGAEFAERFFVEYREPHWHQNMMSLKQRVQRDLVSGSRSFDAPIPGLAFTLSDSITVQKIATHGVRVVFMMDVENSQAEAHDSYFNGFNHSMGFRTFGRNEPYTVTAILLRDGFGGEWRFATAHLRIGNMHFGTGW